MGEVEHGVFYLSISAPGRLHPKGRFQHQTEVRIAELHETLLQKAKEKQLRNEDSTLQ